VLNPNKRNPAASRLERERASPAARFGVGHDNLRLQGVERRGGFVEGPCRPGKLQVSHPKKVRADQRPEIDAPDDGLHSRILSHMKTFCSRYGLSLKEAEPVGSRKLLIGATVSGEASHELPTFHKKLESGMEILVSRPFGDLAPITAYLSCLADEDYAKGLSEFGLTLEEVEASKKELIETMKVPNLKIGQIIGRYCPDYGKPFSASEHIADTIDVSGPGIYVFKEVADNGAVEIMLDRIPLSYEQCARFVTRNYLMDNATAGTNGAIAIIASPEVTTDVKAALQREGYNGEVIGRVIGRGTGKVSVGPEIENMISSQNLLDEFTIRR